jgi:hypothetical protein
VKGIQSQWYQPPCPSQKTHSEYLVTICPSSLTGTHIFGQDHLAELPGSAAYQHRSLRERIGVSLLISSIVRWIKQADRGSAKLLTKPGA